MSARLFLAVALTLALVSSAAAQGTFGPRNLGGGVQGSSGTSLGERQAGDVQAAGAIQRSSTGFVGASSESMVNVRGTQDASGGLGGLGIGGLGVGGLGGLGVGGLGVGGLGGYGVGGMGMGGMGMGGYGMGGMGMNRGGMQNQYGRQGMGQNQQRTINATIRLGFAGRTTSPTVIATRFQQRLTRIPQLKDAGRVTISVASGTAVLEGVVATDHDRDLLGRLALLEPGIDSVQNEIQIDPTAASVTETP